MIQFENFVPQKVHDDIEKAMLKMPWYFNTIENDIYSITTQTPTYFVNLIGCEQHGTTASDAKPFIPLLKRLEEVTGRSYIDRIVRMKANLYTRRPDFAEGHHHLPHLDIFDNETKLGDPGEILLYYANDSDGDTAFFEEKRIDTKNPTLTGKLPHKKGMAILFDNTILHASASPRIAEYRMNVNFVFRR